MARTEEYTDLITMADVAAVSMGGLGGAVEDALQAVPGSGDAIQEIQQAALAQIKAATARIESFLNRKLIVRLQTVYWKPKDWQGAPQFTLPSLSERMRAYFKQFPVVQVVSVDDDVALAGEIVPFGDRLEHAVASFDGDLSDVPTRCAYFAGYRRQDQAQPGSGETWNSTMATSMLALLEPSTEVPVLPYDITQVCANLVIANLRWQLDKLIGVNESTMNAERLNITSRKAKEEYETEQVQMLNRYRKMPF